MNPVPELVPFLKQLRLSGILDSLDARNRSAIDSKMAYTEFLALLIQDEVARREQKKFALRLRRAAFRASKTLEQFDFERLPQLNRALVHELATGRYLTERVPVLIVGPCGTGKSHIAQALGHCAIRQGVDVLFTTCAQLVSAMNAARATGGYERKPGLSFGPESAEWSYTAPKKSDFYAMVISGAHRLPNGNTIICSGTNGTVFEVTSSKEMVWKFVNPSPTRGGGFPGMGGKGTRPPFGGFGTPPGTLLPTFLQDQLKLTEDQKKQLDELQKEVTAKLDKMLTEEQRDQLKKMRDFAGGGFGPPGGGGGMGPGGFGGGGLFRVYRYGVDHPAFAGKTITPGRRIDDVEMK